MRRALFVGIAVVAAAAVGGGIYAVFGGPGCAGGPVRVVKRPTLVVKHPRPTAPRGERSLKLGLHTQAWMLGTLDWSTQKEDHSDPKRVIRRNLDYLVRHHYTVLLQDVMDAKGGTFFFDSPVLKRKAYTQGPKLMKYVVEQAHARKLKVFADPTVLAWRLSERTTRQHGIGGKPLSAELVQKVVEGLLSKTGFDGIVEETFPPDYVAAIYAVTKRLGKTYIHKFDDAAGNADVLMSEDYIGFLSSPAHVKKVARTGADANSLGYFTMLFAHAAALGKPGWVKVGGRFDLPDGAARNVLLLRAVQFQPDGYFWMPATRDCFRWLARELRPRELIDRLELLRTPADKRPLVNFVLALPSGAEAREQRFLFVNQAFGPLANGVMLSGYDIRATYGQALEDADAYVVLAIGKTRAVAMDLPADLLQLLDGDKPVVVVVDGLSDEGNWQKALPKLGIKAGWKRELTTARVDRAKVGQRKVPWAGFPIWGFDTRTALLRASAVEGEVLASAEVDGESVALVVKQGNNYLVNGNVLHLQASYIFNRMLKPTLAQPFFGYGAVGTRSAFFALRDTPLQVTLPLPDKAQLRVTRYGADGRRQSVEVSSYHAPLKTRLRKHELLIAEPVKK